MRIDGYRRGSKGGREQELEGRVSGLGHERNLEMKIEVSDG